MSIPEVVQNAGKLFDEDSLTNLSTAEIDDDKLRNQFDQIREYYDRRNVYLHDGEATSAEVAYYFLGRVLHILGYTHSHNEPLPGGTNKVGYTLFGSPEDFLAHETGRGTTQIYAGAIAVCKHLTWKAPLDGEDETSPDSPAFELDDILRQTGLQWAMLTNGAYWRLYHRNTAGTLDTYYQVHLQEIIETADFDAFRFFASIFEVAGLNPDGSGTSLARDMLQ